VLQLWRSTSSSGFSESFHQIDDVAAGLWPFGRGDDLLALELVFDELTQRFLVMIDDFSGRNAADFWVMS
jgi:hypothetical protein